MSMRQRADRVRIGRRASNRDASLTYFYRGALIAGRTPDKAGREPPLMTPSQRALLTSLYDAAVAAAHPASCLAPHLPPPPASGRLIVLGAGKAAAAMAVTAERHYEEQAASAHVEG